MNTDSEVRPLKCWLAREDVPRFALDIAREFVEANSPESIGLFDNTRRLIEKSLVPQLLSVSARDWRLNEARRVPGLGFVGDDRGSKFAFAMCMVPVLAGLESWELEQPPDRNQLSSLCKKYAKQLQATSKLLEEMAGFFGERLEAAETPVAPPSESPYEIFEGRPPGRHATRAEVDRMWTKRHEFDLFVDQVNGAWFYKDGAEVRPIPLQPRHLEWHFLCFALRRPGGSWGREELRAAMEKVWNYPVGSELWQLRDRLDKKTNGVVGRIVEGQRRGGGYSVKMDSTCLIAEKERTVNTSS